MLWGPLVRTSSPPHFLFQEEVVLRPATKLVVVGRQEMRYFWTKTDALCQKPFSRMERGVEFLKAAME